MPRTLDFSQLSGSLKSFELDGKTINYRAFENIVYVTNPIDSRYQNMNIYIPEAYFQQGTIDGWNADTAPIFFPNQVGGYMPAKAGKPELDKRAGNTPNAIMAALSKGYIVASAGVRGRTEASGKAPAAIVDLKAAVRYLKANDQAMPGDANKIISNGTSAGGALSALLGTSANAPEFEPYLQQLGAASADDTIFAVSAYCPITNLEHADSAYEWQFYGVNDYQKIDITMLDYRVERKLIKGTQTNEQIKLSQKLKNLFPSYGNGTFKRYIEKLLMQSAQTALDKGEDLTQAKWLSIHQGKVINADFSQYAKAVSRQKTTPAFDGVDLSTGENNLFGDAQTSSKHFTDFSSEHSTIADAKRADPAIVKLMNAMNFNSPTQYYRIRYGENDRDTSLAIAALLALKLENSGKQVDFAVPWGRGHSGDYDLDALFAWMKNITKTE